MISANPQSAQVLLQGWRLSVWHSDGNPLRLFCEVNMELYSLDLLLILTPVTVLFVALPIFLMRCL
jgi:hypothetical protein